MSWMTKADAQTLSGISTINDNATATQFVTWARTNGYCVRVAYSSEAARLYNDNGISLTQTISTSVYEIRGLERDFATNLAQYLTSDTTRRWTYYAVDANGDVQAVQVNEAPPAAATKTVYYRLGGSTTWKSKSGVTVPDSEINARVAVARASRVNDAGCWRVNLTYTTYQHLPYNNSATRVGGNWFIPIPMAEATNGLVVSQSATKTFVSYDGSTPIYQKETTVVKEYRYLTETEAASKVQSETASNSRTYDVKCQVSWSSSGGTTYKNVQVRGGGTDGRTAATDKTAVSRLVSKEMGWCVTVTETTYQGTTS